MGLPYGVRYAVLPLAPMSSPRKKPARGSAPGRRTAASPPRPAEQPKDEARTLALLWSARSKVGRSGLTVGAIVQSAVQIADQEGLDAVSMRRLAEELDVGTMSLYTHLPGKAELTDLMVDAVHGELYESVEDAERRSGGF